MMFFRIIIKILYLSVLIIWAGILNSFAGSSLRTQFTILGDGVSDSGVVNDNGIALGIKEFKDVKIFGDSVPDISLTAVASDIIQKRDTMIFFNADTVNNGVYYRKFTINQSGLQPQGNGWVKFCDALFPQETFFNVDRGNNGYIASFIRRSFTTKKYLRVHNGAASLDLDSTSSTGWLFSSQCAMDNDTFLIMYSNDMSIMKVCKIYSSGTAIRKIGESIISNGSATPGNSLMTSVVAFDGTGTIIACWNKGTPKGAKSLHYTFLNRSLNNLIINDSLSQIVGDTNFYYNNAAGVAPYGTGQFAVFFWDVNSLYLSRIRLIGGVAEKTTGTIANGNLRFCVASSSEKFIYVMCKGDIDGNGVSCIEGIRYPLINGSFGVGQKFSNSDPLLNVDISDQYSTMLNCTIDTFGTIGAVWKHSNRSKGSVLAYRGVRYKTGFWTSPVDSLNVNNGDSIQYYPSEVLVSSGSSWFLEDSIRMGCTIGACQNAQWHSFSDLPLLESLKTTCRYYQYRIKINRKTGNNFDSVSTPIVSSVTVPWNVKPVIVSLDSIGIRNGIRRGVTFGTTFTVMSRIDTVYPFITLRDQDNGDLVRYNATWPATGELLSYTSNGFERTVQPITILPLPYDTIVSTQINVRDFQGWNAQSRSINLVSRNSLPQVTIKIKQSGKNDTILINNDRYLNLQEEDTVYVNYSVVDTNDVSTVYGKIRRLSGVTYQTIDSTQSNGVYRLLCKSIEPVDTARFLLDVSDPDTSYGYRLSLVINHKPIIDSISFSGKSAKNTDTIRINAGLPITFRVRAIDKDLEFWDTLNYNMSTMSYNQTTTSVSAVNQFTYIPQTGDSIIRFRVADKYGRADSSILFVKMSWFETDTVKNPLYKHALNTLVNGISLIDRSLTGDTVVIPLLNTGNDTMHITGCMFRNSKNKWLTAKLGTNAINVSNTFTASVILKPMIAENLILEFSALKLTGDSVEFDTVVLTTDDPAHDTMKIPLRFEYNDLPVILAIDPDYIADRPYWALGKKMTMNEKNFPPHAAIQISFSEPMDSVSALNAVMVYSVYDSLNQNRIIPIPVHHVWVQNYTKLRLVPEYTISSTAYGFKPPSGLFIATDSLALHITSMLQDKATTPSGPNSLDIKKINKRSEITDTTFHMKVDSIDFTLIGITPFPGDSQIVSKKPEITLTFSAPIYVSTVDTSKVDNKTLFVSSRYNGGKQFMFDSIYTGTNSATFRLSQNLFYNDSVWCVYKSVSVRNMSGFSIDKNRNGIPAADYDTLSTEDDVKWQYKVKDIKLMNVSPLNGSISNSISPPVVLTFSDPVWSGSFDTSLRSGNKSMSMRSVYSSKSGTFTLIQFSADSTRITMQPDEKYFSDDSISCIFNGFTKMYSYSASDNLPRDTAGSFSYHSWYFLTSNTGFYTYPNPYKPGKDPRHCEINGPCGIWFKNLHSLRRGVNDIAIKIYDMNANVIFDTKKKNGLIHFETGNSQSIPQWLWDTRNMKGELVASGLYIYAVFDKDGKILVKDKLIIVR
jgi:hypothetical protein